MNKQVIQLSMTFVSLFMHLPVYFLRVILYTCTWYLVIVPMYLGSTQVHFAKPCTCTCTCIRTFLMYLYPSNESMYFPQP